MITSPFAASEKSTTAANLAIATAGAGRRVVLLDLDLRRPRLEAQFRLPPGAGVSDVLLEKARLEDAIVQVPVAYRGRGRPSVTFDEPGVDSLHEYAQQNGSGSPESLEVIRAGGPLPSTGDFLLTPTVEQLFDEVGERSDVVIVDGPPLPASADSLTASWRVDALLLVARPKTLRREEVAQVNRVLSVAPATKLGLVVVGDPGSATRTTTPCRHANRVSSRFGETGGLDARRHPA
jgi:non-specific protein-tyrosine kinase